MHSAYRQSIMPGETTRVRGGQVRQDNQVCEGPSAQQLAAATALRFCREAITAAAQLQCEHAVATQQACPQDYALATQRARPSAH